MSRDTAGVGGAGAQSAPENQMRSKANNLITFKKRLRKAAVTLVIRLNKATRILMKMYPGAKSYQ